MTKIVKLVLILGITLITGCSQSADDGDFESLKYSSLLRIERKGDYTRVRIVNPDDTLRNLATYILVDRNSEIPDSLPEGDLIRVPVENIVVYSSVHAAALKEIGALDAVKGIAEAQYFTIPEIKAGLADGSIVDIGSPSSPSTEKIVELNPDAIMASVYNGMSLPDLSGFGVKYLKLADNLEPTPLGRAEWIRLLGMLTGKEAKADSIIKSVSEKYTELKALVSKAVSHPKVITDNLYQGVWYLPAGESYQARMIRDAGASYPWADTKGGGSLTLSIEEVIDKGADAKYWIYKSFGSDLSRDILLKEDSRYSQFSAVNNGGVWYSNTAVSNLFEEFPFHPERLLADYIAIFHPELKLPAPKYFHQMK